MLTIATEAVIVVYLSLSVVALIDDILRIANTTIGHDYLWDGRRII